MNKKQAYEEKLQAQLDEWSAKIATLKAKASKSEAETKVKYYETIEDLQERQASVKSKLQDLREASDDAWEDLKEGVEHAWNSLENAVKSATDRFK